MGARQPEIGMPLATQILSGPFSRSEKLELHIGLFLIGSWNLLIINLARSPHDLWFWPWVAGWVVVLLVHAAVVTLGSRGAGSRRSGQSAIDAGRGLAR
jgi:hypothetical protein